jgi:acyl carrier protein
MCFWPQLAQRVDAAFLRKVKMLTRNADIENRIIAVVSSILEQNAINAEVNAESLLVDVGLSSVDMVNLMLGVEAEFDFTIPQAEIIPENFRSIKTLHRLVVASTLGIKAIQEDSSS